MYAAAALCRPDKGLDPAVLLRHFKEVTPFTQLLVREVSSYGPECLTKNTRVYFTVGRKKLPYLFK